MTATAAYLAILAAVVIALLLLAPNQPEPKPEQLRWDEIPVHCVDCRGV